MIRNKSQTNHYAGSKRKGDTSMDSTTRHKSKKASLNLSKPNQLNYSHMAPSTERKTQSSMLISGLQSNRHSAKTLLASTKGMKIVNHHQSSVKSKLPSVKLQQNTKSAISARILKDLVSHGQNQSAKNKNCVDSFEIISMKKPVSSTNTHRVLQQFSPMPNTKTNIDLKKVDKSVNQYSANRTYVVHDFELQSKEYIKQNFESFNVKKSKDECQKIERKMIDLDENTKNIPTRDEETSQSTERFEERISLSKKNKIYDDAGSSQKKSSIKKFFNEQQPQNSIQKNQYEEKQQLIFTLQRVNTYIEENFSIKYKQIINNWDSMLDLQKQNLLIELQLKNNEQILKSLQKTCIQKKTELYLHNRQYIMNKKQKDYLTRSAKQHYLTQAERIHEELRAKLTSKADYEHVIMFNIKVVLSGTMNHTSIFSVYEQMFKNSLCRKFILIAKKEMGNLSGYDSKIMQDFFKKIQQLQNGYSKVEKQGVKMGNSYLSVGNNENGCGNKQFLIIIEHLVQDIQEMQLQIESLNRKIKNLTKNYQHNMNSLKMHENAIQQHIKNVSQQISQEYRQSQGKNYDFQGMLEKKYEQQFMAYKEEIENRNKIIERLHKIEQNNRDEKQGQAGKDFQWSRISSSLKN